MSNTTFRCLDEGEGEVAVFSAKRWDCRNRADLIESTTPYHDAQVVGSCQGLNPLHMTVLTRIGSMTHNAEIMTHTGKKVVQCNLLFMLVKLFSKEITICHGSGYLVLLDRLAREELLRDAQRAKARTETLGAIGWYDSNSL